jgi:hypothetical protein
MKKITNMTDLEDGMKVRGSYHGMVFYDGIIYLFGEYEKIESIEIGLDVYIAQEGLDEHTLQLFTIDDDELVVREGDVLVKEDGSRRMILGVSGCIAHLSGWDNFDRTFFLYTFKELKERGFTLLTKQPETIQPETIQIEGKTYKKSDIDSLTPIN